MIHAYSELYLNDAKATLSLCFDYLVNDCQLDSDWAAKIFIISGYADMFERGNPSVLSGMSGVELARAILREAYEFKNPPERRFSEELSPEYWAGWALAWYQWHSGYRFKDIFDKVSFSEIVSNYSVYHEMDITKLFEFMDQRISTKKLYSKLKILRENRGLSQSELSLASGVKLRSIQMYEQGVNDIDKAQAITLFRLSRVIGCNVEDLLQNPKLGS